MSEHVIDLNLLATMRDGSGHSIFSPSSSAMWLTCSGSLIPNVLASDEAGEDAAYGTVAHALTEWQLNNKRPPLHRLGTKEWVDSGDWGFVVEIDDEMLEYVQQCVDYCDWLPGDHFVEQRVYFSEYTPLKNQSGTSDHVACTPGSMVITDHKFGKGIVVYAAADHEDLRSIIRAVDGSVKINGNPQGMLYALGTFLAHDAKYHFETITIRIAQPRLKHWDEWSTTRKELLRFAEYVKERSAAAWKPDAPRRPSAKGCQWCAIKHDCAAFFVMQENLYSSAFTDLTEDISVETMEDAKARLSDPLGGYELTPRDPTRLSTEELATIFAYRRISESWWENVHKTLHERALNGENIPGMKLVESRSKRQFKSRANTIKKLVAMGIPRDELVKETLASPAEVERVLKAHGKRAKDLPALLEPLVVRPPGNPTLAPLRDSRAMLSGDKSGSAFADLLNPETEL